MTSAATDLGELVRVLCGTKVVELQEPVWVHAEWNEARLRFQVKVVGVQRAVTNLFGRLGPRELDLRMALRQILNPGCPSQTLLYPGEVAHQKRFQILNQALERVTDDHLDLLGLLGGGVELAQRPLDGERGVLVGELGARRSAAMMAEESASVLSVASGARRRGHTDRQRDAHHQSQNCTGCEDSPPGARAFRAGVSSTTVSRLHGSSIWPVRPPPGERSNWARGGEARARLRPVVVPNVKICEAASERR